MRRIMRIDKDRLLWRVIIVLVVILLLIWTIPMCGGLATARDVVARQDAETINTSGVAHSVCLAIISYVTVLAYPVVIPCGLLSEY